MPSVCRQSDTFLPGVVERLSQLVYITKFTSGPFSRKLALASWVSCGDIQVLKQDALGH